jgi:hypothetical protein
MPPASPETGRLASTPLLGRLSSRAAFVVIVRLLLFTALAAVGVAFFLYLLKGDRRYLRFIAQVAKFTALLLLAVLLYFAAERLFGPLPQSPAPGARQPGAEPLVSRVSDEMAPDARREPRRIAHAYSQGEQRRRRGQLVETRMGSGLAGGLLCCRSLVWGGPHVARSFAQPIPPSRCAATTGFASGC